MSFKNELDFRCLYFASGKDQHLFEIGKRIFDAQQWQRLDNEVGKLGTHGIKFGSKAERAFERDILLINIIIEKSDTTLPMPTCTIAPFARVTSRHVEIEEG